MVWVRMRLEQPPKLQKRGRVGGCFPFQINPDKAPNGLTVVNRIFDTFVRQTKALLHDVHGQHALSPIGGQPSWSRVG